MLFHCSGLNAQTSRTLSLESCPPDPNPSIQSTAFDHVDNRYRLDRFTLDRFNLTTDEQAGGSGASKGLYGEDLVVEVACVEARLLPDCATC